MHPRKPSSLNTDSPTIETALSALGFAPPTTNLIPGWQSGIYVLHLAHQRYYVGQSVNLAGRLTSHRRTFPDLERVSLLKVRRTKADLDAQELKTIQTLERQGFPLLNIVHASITHQSSPFDDLVSPDEQQRWLAEPTALDMGTRPNVGQDVRLKQALKLERLRQRPDADRIIACLRQYATMCIPRPASTEPTYWSVSCMPSINASLSPRIACFNSNTMEIFVVGHLKGNPDAVWAFLNLSNVSFRNAYQNSARFKAAYPGATFSREGYAAAGHDQITLSIQGLDQLERLLHDPDILSAARLFNLHLMRKRTNLYARYHCYDLADLLLSPTVTTSYD